MEEEDGDPGSEVPPSSLRSPETVDFSKSIESPTVSGVIEVPIQLHHHHQQPQQPLDAASGTTGPATLTMFQPEISFSYYNSAPFYGNSKPHNILRDFTDVPKTEENLLQLLSDFHQGKLNAFGENISLDNMMKLRQQQENLARLHFELNTQQSNKPLPQQQTSRSGGNEDNGGPEESGADQPILAASKPFSKINMIKLIQNLQNLCQSIEQLQSKNSSN